MPEFSFHLVCEGRPDSRERRTLSNELAAWNRATRNCAEVIKDAALERKEPTQCEMTVLNDKGHTLFRLQFAANADQPNPPPKI